MNKIFGKLKLKGEVWKRVIGFPLYFISNMGRFASYGRYKKLEIRNPIAWKSGYRFVHLCNKTMDKQIKVSRLVALNFIPNSYNKLEVNHKDGNKTNDCVLNLEWSTRSENQLHAYKLGLQKNSCGEKSSSAKLTLLQVREIRKLKKEGMMQKNIASLFSVARTTINSIVNNYNWKM